MRRQWLRALAAAAAPIVALTIPAAPAQATPGVVVYPGMEIHQGSNVCTLGFVDPGRAPRSPRATAAARGPSSTRAEIAIGFLTSFRDNTPDGATVATDHMISDWETIGLAPDVELSNILPGGRVLVSDPGVVPQPGQPVCHFGVITGESCGTVEAVNNGWFTMANGVVSQKGDSGGPVYVVTPDGGAVIIGMFNSTWGNFPAAVSWQTASQQAGEDVIHAAAG